MVQIRRPKNPAMPNDEVLVPGNTGGCLSGLLAGPGSKEQDGDSGEDPLQKMSAVIQVHEYTLSLTVDEHGNPVK